jgi:hypothetical protein
MAKKEVKAGCAVNFLVALSRWFGRFANVFGLCRTLGGDCGFVLMTTRVLLSVYRSELPPGDVPMSEVTLWRKGGASG